MLRLIVLLFVSPVSVLEVFKIHPFYASIELSENLSNIGKNKEVQKMPTSNSHLFGQEPYYVSLCRILVSRQR